jgi:hypothetical protein
MIYVKSFLAGVAALIIAALIVVALFLGAPILESLTHRTEGAVGFYVFGPWLHMWAVVICAPFIFAAAFYWAFRRGKARQLRAG